MCLFLIEDAYLMTKCLNNDEIIYLLKQLGINKSVFKNVKKGLEFF